MERRAQREGFTLIELSIVLVVIGLIVGGVLVGQNLVRAATVRNDIATLEKLTSAVQAFRGKYDCLPGDCKNASSFFTGVSNGNGDGLINGMNANCTGCSWTFHTAGTDGVMEESSLFYIHLANANMVPLQPFTYAISLTKIGPGVTWMPLNTPTGAGTGSSGAGICPIGWNSRNYYWLGCTTQWAGSSFVNNYGTYTIAAAYAVDTKIDDGLPYTGILQDAVWMNMWNGGAPQNYGCEPRNIANSAYLNQYNLKNLAVMGVPAQTTPCYLTTISGW